MTVALLLLAVAVLVSPVLHRATGDLLRRRRPPLDVLRDRLRATVLVTDKAGHTYRGALWEADHQALVLRGASALDADGSSVGVDGELLILRGDVAYIQRP